MLFDKQTKRKLHVILKAVQGWLIVAIMATLSFLQ